MYSRKITDKPIVPWKKKNTNNKYNKVQKNKIKIPVHNIDKLIDE